MNSTTRKVGRITVAVGLVALGTALLLDNLLGTSPAYMGLILRFWPVLLIGLGLEYLVLSIMERIQEGEPMRLRFDFVGAFLLFVLLGMTAGFHTLSTWISLNPSDYVLIRDGANRTETASTSAEGAQAMTVEIETGRVELYAQKLNEVRVEAEYGLHGVLQLRDEARSIDQFQLTLEGTDTIRVVGKNPSRSNMSGVSATYRIFAPEGLKVQVQTGAGSVKVLDYRGDLDLSAKVGTIYVEAASGSLQADSSSGTIRVEDFTGPITARTNAGSITLQRVDGDLQLNSGTGVIHVRDYSGGKLAAETGNGSISVQTTLPLAGDIQLRTSTGSINLDLPGELDAKVTAQTRTGSITAPPFISVNQSSATARSVEWTSGEGRYQVNVEANLGSIHLNMQQAPTPPRLP